MRTAELIMAFAMAILSISIMVKSGELPIGWLKGQGPGGGAFPFWLAAGMLLCCIAIVIRWFRRASHPSRSTEPFMTPQALQLFALGAGSLTVMIALIHAVGVYVSVPLFLVFYMRVLGHHGWALAGAIAAATPVAAFFFFEIALKITLPKGFTEPAFYPLYDIFL